MPYSFRFLPRSRRRIARAVLPLAAGTLALTPLTAPRPAEAQFSRVIAFGDSLTDNGNVLAISTGLGNPIPKPPYFNGRMSNGPVWVETFASILGVPLTDIAVTGSRTDTSNVGNTIPGVPPGTFPGMQTQVNGFLAANGGVVDPNALYVLWGGANDYLNGGQLTPDNPVNNIAGQMISLATAGARNFLVANLPDLGSVPLTSGSPASPGLNLLTAAHNTGLSTALTNFQASRPETTVSLLDVNSLFRQAILNPGAFGFTNVTDNYVTNNGGIQGLNPTVIGVGDPNNYLFWDELHPTATTHNLIASQALAAVSPEPGSLALAGVGLFGVAAVARRRRRTSVKG